MKQKNELREEAKKRRDSLDLASRQAGSLAIARKFGELALYRGASQILLYLPIHSEVTTEALAELAWADGKKVYAPVVDEKNRSMSFYRFERGEVMKTGAYGVTAPLAVSSRKADMGRPCLVVCPCLSFDRDGVRLGYGAGYYDRFLAGPARVWKSVALAYAAQEEEGGLPSEEHDQRMQFVVTEKETINCVK